MPRTSTKFTAKGTVSFVVTDRHWISVAKNYYSTRKGVGLFLVKIYETYGNNYLDGLKKPTEFLSQDS
jgi:hypothetical protein